MFKCAEYDHHGLYCGPRNIELEFTLGVGGTATVTSVEGMGYVHRVNFAGTIATTFDVVLTGGLGETLWTKTGVGDAAILYPRFPETDNAGVALSSPASRTKAYNAGPITAVITNGTEGDTGIITVILVPAS